MRGLSAPKNLRPGLMVTGNLSRGEVYCWSRDRTRREAEIRPCGQRGGGMITLLQEENPQRTIVAPTDGEAHDVAREYVATGRMLGKRDG